jgi:hypothetical protein
MSILSQFIKSIHPSSIINLFLSSLNSKQNASLSADLDVVQLALLVAQQAAPTDKNVIKAFTIISDIKSQLNN